MAVNYTGISRSRCASAPAIWTLTEVAQQLAQINWPDASISGLGPSDNATASGGTNPPDVTLRCINSIYLYAAYSLTCDDVFKYPIGVVWELSTDYGISWQQLANSYNLNGQRMSIGHRLLGTPTVNTTTGEVEKLVYKRVLDEKIVREGEYQFYGYIDSIRISAGIPRYVEDTITPYDPHVPILIDAHTLFTLNLGFEELQSGGTLDYRNDATIADAQSKVGTRNIRYYIKPRAPIPGVTNPIPHPEKTAQNEWDPTTLPASPPATSALYDPYRPQAFRVILDPSNAAQRVLEITESDRATPIDHPFNIGTSVIPAERIVFERINSAEFEGFPTDLIEGQPYFIQPSGFSATYFKLGAYDNENPSALVALTTGTYPNATVRLQPVFDAAISPPEDVITAGFSLLDAGALTFSNLIAGHKRRVDKAVSTLAARNALSGADKFIGMCVEVTNEQTFYVLDTANTWQEVPGFSPAIQFLTDVSNYTTASKTLSNYLAFEDISKRGYPNGQFNFSVEQRDFCIEGYFKVIAFQHSYDGEWAAVNFKSILINTQSWEDQAESAVTKLSGDGVRIYVTPHKTLSANGVLFNELLIGDLHVDIGFNLDVLRVEGLIAGRFYHIALTRQSDTYRLYLDGIKVDELDLQPQKFLADGRTVDTNHHLYRTTWTRGALQRGLSADVRVIATRPTFLFFDPDTVYCERDGKDTTIADDSGYAKRKTTTDTPPQDLLLNYYYPVAPVSHEVAAATTSNITLAAEQTVDGILVEAGDNVLVKNQTDATENGVYTVSAGAWSRAVTFEDTAALTYSRRVRVAAGTTNCNRVYVLNGVAITTPPTAFGAQTLTFSRVNTSEDTHVYIFDDAVPDIHTIEIIANISFKELSLGQTVFDLVSADIDDEASFALSLEENTAVGPGLVIGTDSSDQTKLVPPPYGPGGTGWRAGVSTSIPSTTESKVPITLRRALSVTDDRLVVRVEVECSNVFGYSRNVVFRARSFLQPLIAVFGIVLGRTASNLATTQDKLKSTLRHRVRVATGTPGSLADESIFLRKNASGATVVDGVTLQNGDLILVKNDVKVSSTAVTADANGIYVFNDADWDTKWARANLLNKDEEFTLYNRAAGLTQAVRANTGLRVEVLEGTNNAGKVFRLALDNAADTSTYIAPDAGTAIRFTDVASSTVDANDVSIAAEPVIQQFSAAVDRVTLLFSKPLATATSLNAAVTSGDLKLYRYATQSALENDESPAATTTLTTANVFTVPSSDGSLYEVISLATYTGTAGFYKLVLATKAEGQSNSIRDASANLFAFPAVVTWQKT